MLSLSVCMRVFVTWHALPITPSSYFQSPDLLDPIKPSLFPHATSIFTASTPPRDIVFLAALKHALSPSSPRCQLRETVLLNLGEVLPRLAAGVDTLSLSQVVAPFQSQADETRFRQEARDGIMDMLKLFFEVRRGYVILKEAEGSLRIHPFDPAMRSLRPPHFPPPPSVLRPANPRETAPALLLSMPWTRCWR